MEELIKKILEELRDKNLLDSEDWAKISFEIDKILENSDIANESFKSEIKEVLSSYPKNVAEKYAKLELSTERLIKNNLKEYLVSSIGKPLKEAIFEYQFSGGTFANLVKSTTELLKDVDVKSNATMVAKDTLFQYRRNITYKTSIDLGIKYFKYQGTEMDTTRCFCLQRIGQIYTIDEIKKWANLKWDGKISGTNSTNIMNRLGGFNCLHSLVPVSESLAKQRGFNKYNPESCDLVRPKKKKK